MVERPEIRKEAVEEQRQAWNSLRHQDPTRQRKHFETGELEQIDDVLG